MKRGLLAGALALFSSSPAWAQTGPVADAERAYQSVDFPATHSLAEQALHAGKNPRDHTARLYVLLGMSAAALGDVEEAKQDFIVALAVDPALKLDKSLAPKIRAPYLEAQGYWAASAERLALQSKPASIPEQLIVHLSDPGSFVSRIELRVGPVGELSRSTFALAPSKATRFKLPNTLSKQSYEYTLRALDAQGNVLAEQGSDTDPEVVHVAAPRSRDVSPSPERSRSYVLPLSLGVAGLGSIAAAVVFHIEREQAAHDWNGPNCENPGHTRLGQCQSVDSRRQNDERLAIGFYAAGGALLTGSLIALLAGHTSDAPASAGSIGCSVFGTSVRCDGHF